MMNETIAEIMMQVVRGKVKVKFPLFMLMSPGSRPSHGIRSERVNSRPIKVITAPMVMRVLPRSVILRFREVALFFAVDAAAILLAIESHLL